VHIKMLLWAYTCCKL